MPMRSIWGVALTMAICGVSPGEDAVHAEPAEVVRGAPAVAVMEIKALTGGPAWFGQNIRDALLKDIAEMPDVYVSRLNSKGEYWPAPEYVLMGRYRATAEGVLLECDIVSVQDERVVLRIGTRGAPADLMAVKDEIRRQLAMALHQLAPTEPEAVVASAVLPPAATTQPVAAPVEAQAIPGSDYENSRLRWALENPDDFDRELDYWSRRSTLPARYGAFDYAGPYGQLGGYPYIRYPNSYVLVPGEKKPFGRFQFPYTYSITQTPPKKTGK